MPGNVLPTITVVTKYIVCPACHQPDQSIDHLEGKGVTMWYCRKCGVRYAFKYDSGEVTDLGLTGERIEKRLVLLRRDNIGLVVVGRCLPAAAAADNSDPTGHHAYYYNEHTCPVNYMRDAKAVIDLDKKDTDPHGIFEYVTTLPWNRLVEEADNDEFLETLLPHFEPSSAFSI
jgi:ribosomal protein L37AE/L43A